MSGFAVEVQELRKLITRLEDCADELENGLNALRDIGPKGLGYDFFDVGARLRRSSWVSARRGQSETERMSATGRERNSANESAPTEEEARFLRHFRTARFKPNNPVNAVTIPVSDFRHWKDRTEKHRA